MIIEGNNNHLFEGDTIVLEGALTVITQGGKEIKVNGPIYFSNGAFSESFYGEPKPAQFKCISECKVLFLQKSNLDLAHNAVKTDKTRQA